jgi:tetratricopeptide (TPR) repeat protein
MPEKGLNEITRSLREQYEKGLAAIHRNNLDYAIAILTSVLQAEPAFYPAREALRDAQFRKAGKRGGFLRKVFGTAGNSPLLAKAQIELRNNPAEAMQTAEQVLNSDPYSVAAHKIVAHAAKVLDLPRTGLFSMQVAFKTSPDRDIALELGQALARAGQVDKGEAVLADLLRTFPNDAEVAQVLKDVAARRTLNEGGYGAFEGGQGSYRDVLRDRVGAETLERQGRQAPAADAASRVLSDYDAQLGREPDNLKLWRAKAELHVQHRQYDEALACYRRILGSEGGNEPTVERAITQTTLRRFEDELARLDPMSPDFVEAQGKLQVERDEYEHGRMRELVAQYPNDLGLRFEMGEMLFRRNRMTEAIQEFQKAQNHPHQRVRALFYLGQCFARRGILDLAARTLETAIREKPMFDEEKKELIYTLAGVFEQMGRKADALDQLKLIYEVDIGFRDVAARVDAFYSGAQQ